VPSNVRSVGDPSLDGRREDGQGHTATGPMHEPSHHGNGDASKMN